MAKRKQYNYRDASYPRCLECSACKKVFLLPENLWKRFQQDKGSHFTMANLDLLISCCNGTYICFVAENPKRLNKARIITETDYDNFLITIEMTGGWI